MVELSQCPEHIPVLTEWFWNEWGQYRIGNSPQAINARLHTFLNAGRIPITLVALQNNIPIGTASIRRDDMAIRPALQPWLASVYVIEQARQQGIGSSLVTEAERYVREEGHQKLYLYTHAQEHFYARLGWITEERVFYHDKDQVIMSKRLIGALR